MKWYGWKLSLAVAGWLLIGVSGMTQDADPPFTWVGKGESVIQDESGITNYSFTVKLQVDSVGEIEGEAFNDEGRATVEKLYYGEKGEKGRQLILVLTIQDSDNPKLILFQGRALRDHLFYGEIFAKDFSKTGAVEKDLDLENKTAVSLESGEVPQEIKAALEQSRPIGCFKIIGDFEQK